MEEVLHELFDAYGVNELCVLQRSAYVEVFVEFQSWYEASQARGALHGRCIYDVSCLLDIQHAPPSISVHRLPNSEPVVVDWDCVEMADHVELEPLISAPTPSASTSAPASATITSMAICEIFTKVHSDAVGIIVDKALDSEEVVALPAAPHDTASSTVSYVNIDTVNIFPEPAAAAVCEEALDIDTGSVAAPTPATCSTGLKPQGQAIRPAPWPSFIDEHTNTAHDGIGEPPPTPRPLGQVESEVLQSRSNPLNSPGGTSVDAPGCLVEVFWRFQHWFLRVGLLEELVGTKVRARSLWCSNCRQLLREASKQQNLLKTAILSIQMATHGGSHSVIINGTDFFDAYLELSWDPGDHDMCWFLSNSGATLLCQKLPERHASIYFLFSNIRELKNTHSTLRQWDPGTVQLISTGMLAWTGNLSGLGQCARRSFELLALHLVITPLCALKIFDKWSPWRRNTISPGNNETQRAVEVFHYSDVLVYALHVTTGVIQAELSEEWGLVIYVVDPSIAMVFSLIEPSGFFPSTGGTSPSEPVSILPLQSSAVFEPDKPTLHTCSTECFDEDVSRTMSMFSLVPVGDGAQDVDMYVMFDEGLHHEWQPWPPQLQVWISHTIHICRPQPWPSFACNRQESVHMTLACLSRRTPYLELLFRTRPLRKCLCTECSHFLCRWWSPASSKEQWSSHDIDLGVLSVCSSIPGILGLVIKLTNGRCTCESLIKFTHMPSAPLVLTLLEPYVCGVLNCKHFAGTIKVYYMNLLLVLNVWEDGKFRVLSVDLSVQWDPGIRNIILMLAIIWGNQKTILGSQFHANTAQGDHLLDEMPLCQDSGQHGICQNGSVVQLTRRGHIVDASYNFYGISVEDGASRCCPVHKHFCSPLVVLCYAVSETLALLVISPWELVFVILDGDVEMDR